MSRRRGKPKVDRERWPHVYVGPTTAYGLPARSACRITGKRAGGREIQTTDLKRWIVARQHVERVQ